MHKVAFALALVAAPPAAAWEFVQGGYVTAAAHSGAS